MLEPYTKTILPTETFKEPPHVIPTKTIEDENGKPKWSVKTYTINHGLGWKVAMGLLAILATLGTAIIGAFVVSNIKDLWRKALHGKEIYIVKGELKPEDQKAQEIFSQNNPPVSNATVSQQTEDQKKKEQLGQNPVGKPSTITPPLANLPLKTQPLQGVSQGNIQQQTGPQLQPFLQGPPPFNVPQNQGAGPEVEIPLPDLLNFEMPANHPLTKRECLLYPNQRENGGLPDRMGVAPFEGAVETFLRCPYNEWEGKDRGNFGISELADFTKAKEAVNNRVRELNTAIQFSDRLKMIENPFKPYIKLQDLEEDWQNSGLRIALMTFSEFKTLSIGAFTTLNERQKTLVEQRARPLMLATSFDETKFNENNFQSLTILQFRALTSAKVNELLPFLPDELMQFITYEQMKGLNVNDLTAGKRAILFRLATVDDDLYTEINQITQKRIRLLDPDQMHVIIKHFNKPLLDLISNDQLRKINFAQLSDKQFMDLFPPIWDENENEPRVLPSQMKIKELTQPQLLALLPRLHPSHMFLLSQKQTENFNFGAAEFTALTEDKKKQLINGLFRFANGYSDEHTQINKRIELLTKENLNHIWPYLNPEIIKRISNKQILEHDFINVPISKAQFNALFPKRSWPSLSRLGEIKNMNFIYFLLQHFEPYHMVLLSDEQIEQFEKSNFSHPAFKARQKQVDLWNALITKPESDLAYGTEQADYKSRIERIDRLTKKYPKGV